MNTKKFRENCSSLWNLLEKAEKLESGFYNIVVATILGTGIFSRNEPEVAVVQDDQGRIIALPEKGTIVSRWDIRQGMKLRLSVEEGKITDISVLNN